MDTNKTPEALLQEQLLKSQEDAKELQRKLTAETTDHNTTRQELKDANGLIDELNKQLAEKPKAAEHLVTLGVGGNAKKYRVLHPKFNYGGTIYKREDVKSNSDLLKELVEKRVVVELVEAAK